MPIITEQKPKTNLINRIAANPWMYDTIQNVFGFKQIAHFLQPFLAQTVGKTVLDVGAGTGNFYPLLPESAQYIWLDEDTHKLNGFKAKSHSSKMILSDAAYLPLKDKSVDYAILSAVAHHLTDEALNNLFTELRRVIRTKLIFWEPVKYHNSRISDLLWKLDQGSYPRASANLSELLKTYFHIEESQDFAVYHHYLFCMCAPKK